jgi:hypothetical protein
MVSTTTTTFLAIRPRRYFAIAVVLLHLLLMKDTAEVLIGAFPSPLLALSTSSSSSSSLSSSSHYCQELAHDEERDRQRRRQEQEENAVREQMGYLPPNFVRVVSWTQPRGGSGRATTAGEAQPEQDQEDQGSCRSKEPVVIQTYPLDGGSSRRQRKAGKAATPFPTLYWLCHAKIHRAVGELERLGYGGGGHGHGHAGKVVGKNTSHNRIVLTQHEERLLFECHRQYARDRWRSLSDADRDQLLLVSNHTGGRVVLMLKESGIAGVQNVTNQSSVRMSNKITSPTPCRDDDDDENGTPLPSTTTTTGGFKCLHAHYAHYRVDGTNPVGAHVERLLRRHFPDLEL